MIFQIILYCFGFFFNFYCFSMYPLSNFKNAAIISFYLIRLTLFTIWKAFIKNQEWRYIYMEIYFLFKRHWHRYFPVNFAKFLRTPFLQNTSGKLLLNIANELFLAKLKQVKSVILQTLQILHLGSTDWQNWYSNR